MVDENDIYRIPGGHKLRVSEITNKKIILLNDNGMQVIFTKLKFTQKVESHQIIPEENYEEIVREEIESDGPPAWVKSDL